ncbi:hypothetical protein TIFTF001_004353 [Ficus carica]|uniref:Uncharacterized protein n=1 Tax=Ficus carica TaxID=3494 RepID=A0AA87ZBA9_FICCA|nr:hypothetical protein TIFTF001_004353 [Ficus carica]
MRENREFDSQKMAFCFLFSVLSLSLDLKLKIDEGDLGGKYGGLRWKTWVGVVEVEESSSRWVVMVLGGELRVLRDCARWADGLRIRGGCVRRAVG